MKVWLEDQHNVLIISPLIFPIMGNISDKSSRESQNRHFMFLNIFFFFKFGHLWDVVKNYCRAGQATADNMVRAHFMLDIWGYKHALIICITYCFSTATMVARARLIVTLYIHYLSCHTVHLLCTIVILKYNFMLNFCRKRNEIWFWFPMGLLGFFIDLILLAALWLWYWLSLREKWVLWLSPAGQRRLVCRADNLTSTMSQLSRNSGIFHLWEPYLFLIGIAVPLGQELVEGCFEHRNGTLFL